MARGAATDSGAVERVASQFFNELDSLTDLSQVIVLGATHRVDLLDPSLMRTGRLDYILNFPVPDEKARLEILRVHTLGRPLASDVDLIDLARSTESMVGSQLASICRGAALKAITGMIRGPQKKSPPGLMILAEHFREAIRSVRAKEGGAPC